MDVERLLSAESVAVVLLLAASAFVLGMQVNPQNSGSSDEVLTWENTITVEKNGVVIARFHNTLADQGQDWIKDQISDADEITAPVDSNASFIAVGNGSDVQAGHTILDQEITTGGLSRAEGTTKSFGPGEFQVQQQFTATADIGTVNTTSLNWNSSGPSLISGGPFSGGGATILTDDQLTVTHNITIS